MRVTHLAEYDRTPVLDSGVGKCVLVLGREGGTQRHRRQATLRGGGAHGCCLLEVWHLSEGGLLTLCSVGEI